jgi:hypothetical protein
MDEQIGQRSGEGQGPSYEPLRFLVIPFFREITAQAPLDDDPLF